MVQKMDYDSYCAIGAENFRMLVCYGRRYLWHARMLREARDIASWSKDPSTKVGAVLAKFNAPHESQFGVQLVGRGYNGFPRRVFDLQEDLHDRDVKYSQIVHAEVNAVLDACGKSNGAVLYTWPFPTCSNCMPIMLQAGIAHFVSPAPSRDIWSRWGESLTAALKLAKKANVLVCTVPEDWESKTDDEWRAY